MNARITLATASRILRQLRRDHRTLALMLVVPCVLLGLLLPRDQLPSVLGWISDVLPLSYAVDAMKDVTVLADPLADVLPSLAVVTGWIALALVLGSLTLRRRTP